MTVRGTTSETRNLGVVIRPARSAEAPMLTSLALRSKASWGYDEAFLEACIAPLAVDATRIESSPTFVIEDRGHVVGFYGLAAEGDDADLAYMFVEPMFIGLGYGALLWRHAVQTARNVGFRRLRIESDPNAAAFYLAMGAERIGEAPSGAVAGRMLPLLIFHLDR